MTDVLKQVSEWQTKNPEGSLQAAFKALNISHNQYYYAKKHAKKARAPKAAATKGKRIVVTTDTRETRADNRMVLIRGTPEQLRQLLGGF